MEALINFFQFFQTMMKYRFGTGFSSWLVRNICDRMGYLVVDVKEVSDKESIIDIKTDYGYIRVRVLDWQKISTKFIPGKCSSQNHDVYEMSYSLEDGTIPWEDPKLPVVVNAALGD